MLGVGVGKAAEIDVAAAVDHLKLVAFLHPQDSDGVSGVAFGEFGRAGYVGSEKLYHRSVSRSSRGSVVDHAVGSGIAVGGDGLFHLRSGFAAVVSENEHEEHGHHEGVACEDHP